MATKTISQLPDGESTVDSTALLAFEQGSTTFRSGIAALVNTVSASVENTTLHTGVRKDMSKSINAGDSDLFDVASGTAIKVDRTDPLNVIVTTLTFAGVTGQLDTNLTVPLSHVYVDIDTGVVTTELNPPTVSDIINRIYLGELLHDNANTIVAEVPNPIIATGSSDTEIIGLAFGDAETLDIGVLVPDADLMLATASSILKQHGRGFALDPNTPNTVNGPQQVPIPIGDFFLAFIDGSGNLAGSGAGNDLDPLQYNLDGAGTLVNVPNNRFQKIRVFEAGITNDKIFYYGTEDFASSSEALNDLGTAWVEHEGTRDISPKAILAIRQDVTCLSSAQASGFFVIVMIRTRSQL